MIRRLAAAGMALALLGSGRAYTAPIGERDGQFFVDCEVNGFSETCQLDTGDNMAATLRPLPGFQRLPVVRAGKAMGVSGALSTSYYVHLDSLRVGETDLKGLEDVTVLGRSYPSSALGMGFFRRLGAVTFDFRRMELTPALPAAGRRCPGAFAVDPLIRIPGALAGQPMAMAWDTGAGATVADAAFVREHPELFDFVRDLPDSRDATHNRVPARLYRVRTLSICGQDFSGAPIVAMDMSAPRAVMPNFPPVTLGADLMRGHVWSFDFRTLSWSFE